MSETKKQESINEFNLIKGTMAAVLVGFTGSAMSLGFEQGNPISETAVRQGVDPLFAMMPMMMVLFAGTFVTHPSSGALTLGNKNCSLKNYRSASTAKVLTWNYLFGLLAGLLWF